MKLNRYTTLAALALLTTAASNAAVIIPTAVTATSEYNGGSGDFRTAALTIDGSGLSGGLHNQNPDPSSAGGMWLTDGTQTATITFDLGSVQTIDQLIVWNYNERTYGSANAVDYGFRGVKDFSLLADNSVSPTTLIGAFTLAKNVIPVSATTTPGAFGFGEYGLDYTGGAQTISLSAPVTARYFSFAVTSSHTTSGDNYTGLSEVRFNAVPEASSCALLGLGLLGLVSRRRRNA